MNKIITTFILAGLLFACKPKSENIKPVGEITCKELTYKEIGIGNVVEVDERYEYKYDTKGNLIKKIYYTKSNGSETKSAELEYFYNAANQQIRRVTNRVSNTGVLTKESEILYEYHANGKMKKWTGFFLDFTKPSGISEFNENGDLTLLQYSNGSYNKMEYNSANLLVKQTSYDAFSKQTNEYLYEYNSQNLEVKSSNFVNGVLDHYFTYEYNAKGQVIKSIWYNANGTINTKYVTEYTGENYKNSTYNAKDELTGFRNTEVQNGLIMKESGYYGNELLYYTNYTYDSHKNITRRETFDGKSVMTQRQEWSFQCD